LRRNAWSNKLLTPEIAPAPACAAGPRLLRAAEETTSRRFRFGAADMVGEPVIG
jgi:hypothetical protein